MMEENQNKRVIEINGVKMEIDMRHARVATVENLRVGDPVKVLTKSYSGFEVSAGTVIGFEPFQKLPTIIVAYLTRQGADLKFLYFNAESKDTEVVKAGEVDLLNLDRVYVERQMNKRIEEARLALTQAEDKLTYFRENFAAYWPSDVESEKA